MLAKSGKTARFWPLVAMIASLTIVNIAGAVSVDVSAALQTGDPLDNGCGLLKDCDPTPLSESSYKNFYQTDKSTWHSLGLDPKLLHINEIAVGFVPGFLEKENPNKPEDINKKLFKPMSIMGDYISISSWDKEFKAIDWHIKTVQNLKGNPVWCIALMPSEGLDSISYHVANRIAMKMKQVNDLGITVWLRFAHEMNGEWYTWGLQPEKFKEKWEMLAREVKRVTNRTYMLWSPNAMFGHGVGERRGGYSPYWPDPSTVDICGLSFYHWGIADKRTNVKPTRQEAIRKLYEFAQIYGRNGWNKPIIVAETAACYTTYAGTTNSVGGGFSELEIKMTWLHLLVDRYIKRIIPDLKAVIWFEVDKVESPPGTGKRYNEDFRLVLGNPEVSWAVRELFASYQNKELAKFSERQ
ncbi:hypothetical protein PTTG_00018 [Puccinia triticina 1-1 BBBD Race 1]|uniref:GH26 domain-containing protein n=2 Tax=Puccinia triticina TaxID=208348 RepID=A0A180H2H8_PUCT1|nr:uncharacterized protein PtA15_4A99 [Puccinia triticina]OAV99205.1 hypothetical protein PTTG_00018 [Puccinia triticina 1-1 BBBD Race 1]WAQ83651.1 hypothetical protein PtA15_4A99 [Puccinia triticina]WAR54493.1 hypothetical protein PtB15_4B110 [Puccinia triticina]